MRCAYVSMIVSNHLVSFVEPSDDDLDVGIIYAGVLSDLLRGTRGVNDARQDMIARIAVFPDALELFPGTTKPFRARRDHGDSLADRTGIPAIVYRSFQTAFPAPTTDSIHDRLLRPAIPDQEER